MLEKESGIYQVPLIDGKGVNAFFSSPTAGIHVRQFFKCHCIAEDLHHKVSLNKDLLTNSCFHKVSSYIQFLICEEGL